MDLRTCQPRILDALMEHNRDLIAVMWSFLLSSCTEASEVLATGTDLPRVLAKPNSSCLILSLFDSVQYLCTEIAHH